MAEGGNRVPSSVSVIDAHELLQAGHRYLDVRTPEEFSQGHATGAINVPYMNRGNFIAFCKFFLLFFVVEESCSSVFTFPTAKKKCRDVKEFKLLGTSLLPFRKR